jgi:hypothetical protein
VPYPFYFLVFQKHLQRRHVDDDLRLCHQTLEHLVRQLMVHLMVNDKENFLEHLYHLCEVRQLNQEHLQVLQIVGAQQNQDALHLVDFLTLADAHPDELVWQVDEAYLFHCLHYQMDYCQHVVDVALGYLFQMDCYQEMLDAQLQLVVLMNLNLLLVLLVLHVA